MRPICHPDYVYRPWSRKRREVASAKASARVSRQHTVYGVPVPFAYLGPVRKAAYKAMRQHGLEAAIHAAYAEMSRQRHGAE